MRPPSRPESAIFRPWPSSPSRFAAGHAAVLEQDLRGVAGVLAELVFEARDDVARRRRRHDEGADALLAGGLVGDRHDDRDVAVLAAGDELLDAVEHVVVAVARPPSSSGRRPREPTCGSVRQNAPSISPRASGFSHCSFCASFAHAIRIEQTGQLLTLTIGRGGAVAGGDLLEDDREREVVEAGAVVLGRHRDAVAAERGQALQLGLREVAARGPSAPRAARCGPARSRARRPARRRGRRRGSWRAPRASARAAAACRCRSSSRRSAERASPSSRVIQPARLSFQLDCRHGPAQVDVLVGVDRRAKADVEAHAEARGAAGRRRPGLAKWRRGHRHEDAAELRARGDQAAVAGGARRGDVVMQRVEVVDRGREGADLVVAEAHTLA